MSETGSIDISAYSPDSPDGADYFGIDGDVESIASLVAARALAPPLCVGIFGSEGSGVSFFLKRVQARVDQLVRYRDTSGNSRLSCSAIQLTYNPYHYAGTNQWVALTERVFQALQDSMSRNGVDAGVGFHLLENLGTAGTLQRELVSKRESAQRVVEIEQHGATRAQKEYDDALREHASRQSQSRWAEIDMEFAKRIARGSSASDLDRAGDIIGLPGLSRDTEALHKVLEEAKTIGGRASLLNSTLTAQRFVSNAFLVGVVVLLVGLASWVFTTMFSGMTDVGAWVETVQNTLGAIATIGTFFVIVGALLIRNRAANAIDILRRDERTLKEVIDEVDRQRDYREVLARQQELVRQRQIEGSSARLAEAERNLGLAEQALAEMGSAGVQRGVTESYRTLISSRLDLQPSIVPVIREDFEALTQLLAARDQDRQDARTPERIIIYIDDLDQCPPAAVADVIQVVQLLLSFPIFVVVIGANPAWLMASIETRYDVRAHQGSDSLSTYLASPAVRSVRTLSKCIHVPFWLAPLTRHSARHLVHSILGPSVTPAPDEPQPSTATSLPAALPVESEAIAAAVRPAIVEIAGAELAFLEEVAGILADSPRTVKRLVNCYQVLRAILPVASVSAFVGNSGGFPGYIAAIAQLGLLISAPLAAPRYVELLKRSASLEDLRGALRAQEGIDPAEMEVMLDLIDAYSRSAGGTSNVEMLRRWISPAARFSFTVPPTLAAEAAFEL